jgi:four helix bundle protein
MRRVDDLVTWQRGMVLVETVYRVTGSGAFERDWALRGQIRRSAVSVVANIAEGFDRGSRPEFARFLQIAKGSSGEVRTLVIVGGRVGLIPAEESGGLISLCEEVTGLIARLRAAVRTQTD